MAILIIALISFLLVFAIYGTRFSILHITRFFTFVILGLMFINPVFKKTYTKKEKPVVVVDASQSMSLSKKWGNTLKILSDLRKRNFKILYLVDTLLTDRVSNPSGIFTDLSIPLNKIQLPIILISDGYHNAGGDLSQSISLRRYPIYTIVPETETPKPKLKILSTQLPGVVLDNETPTLKVSTNFVPEIAQVFIDGQMFRKLTPQATDFEVLLPALSEGIHRLSLRVKGKNNEIYEITKKIESISPRLKVQILANRISPLLSYLRRYFAPIAKLDIWVKSKPNEWRLLGQTKVTIRQPEKQNGLTILIDPNNGQITQYRTGPRIIFLGKHSATLRIEGVRVSSSPQAGYLVTDKLDEKFPLLKNIWTTRVTDSAVVILKGNLKGGGTSPLLYLIPTRKMAISTTTELWKIALVNPQFVDSVFDRTLDNLLASQVYFNVSMKKSKFVANEPITISSRLLDYRGRRIIGGWVKGITEKDTVFFVEMDDGNFVSQPFTLPSGLHKMELEYGQGKKILGKRSIDINVSTENIEMLGTGVDSLTLSEIAKKTGGKMFKQDQLQKYNELIFTKTDTKSVSPFRTLWALLALVGILVFEWVARQRKGLL